jgi:hypothetical protein
MMQGPKLSFGPPSDFVEEPSGSGGGGKGKWLKIAGIGCGAILLITAILFGLGAFKAVSCCGDLKTAGMQTVGAQQTVLAFGSAVSARDWSAAHGEFTQGYGGEMSTEKLEQTFAPYIKEGLLENTVALSDNLRPDKDINELSDARQIETWRATVRFFPKEPREHLLAVTIKLTKEGEPSEEGIETMKITDLTLEKLPVDINGEPPVMAVRQLHGFLQAGNTRNAYNMLSPTMQKEQNMEAFMTFVDEQGDLLVSSTMDVRQLAYADMTGANVVAKLTSASGKKAIVTYEVGQFMGAWRIVSITPLIETVGDGGEDGSGADPSAPEGGVEEDSGEPVDGGEEAFGEEEAERAKEAESGSK